MDERAFVFLCEVIRFARAIRPEPGVRRLVDQVIAAAGSIGANRQEANGASSKKEFIRYNQIALRSANESALWLRALVATEIGDSHKGPALLGEASQIAKILGAIIVNAKANGQTPRP